MMSKKRNRDYADSKGNTSLWRSFGHSGHAMYENVILRDKTGEKLAGVSGGILAGVIGLKTRQVICQIFSSLDAASAFVAPAERERLSKNRKVKTILVVTPPNTWELGGANQGACQAWYTQSLRVSWTEARAQYQEASSIRCHPHDLPDCPRRFF